MGRVLEARPNKAGDRLNTCYVCVFDHCLRIHNKMWQLFNEESSDGWQSSTFCIFLVTCTSRLDVSSFHGMYSVCTTIQRHLTRFPGFSARKSGKTLNSRKWLGPIGTMISSAGFSRHKHTYANLDFFLCMFSFV